MSNVKRHVRTLVLGLVIWMASGALLGQEGPRSTRPSFKGVELYSWKDCASCEWQFALLSGTNRLKTLTEIKEPTRAISGVAELRRRLSRLAVGEQVFWRSRSLPELSFPEPETIAEVVSFSAQRKIAVIVEQ